MKMQLLKEYDSLEKIMEYLKGQMDYDISIEADQWITDGSLMLTIGKKCIIVKKSATAGAKIELLESSIIDIHPVTPHKFLDRALMRGILAMIVNSIISSSQVAVAQEVNNLLTEIEVK
ncbi:hypothetical protein [Reichenbachiella versicolor]|uniref:hypothetical protein n=1 Tax=Reichenbachiella versicolor TaxID=1821036 RepID=UPI0013A570C9|nr:hypothetical protein [Reichenbachiella versicolor]